MSTTQLNENREIHGEVITTATIEDDRKPTKIKKSSPWRQDVMAWMASLFFVILLLIGIWGWGVSLDWYAPSGYYHDDVNSSKSRFLTEPKFCNETSEPGRFGIDCEIRWYYWKLPTDDVTRLTSAIAWLLYSTHQLLIWGLIYRAQLTHTLETRDKKYSTDLRWFNWSMLGVNGIFHILHLLQTHWTYDGLAQDVSSTTMQNAAVMMLSFIILLEYRDRGIVLMWPNPRSDDRAAKYLRLNQGPIDLIRKYHGYAFSWVVIYTFWYHPMENTAGHIVGFLHTAMVLLQGSLVYTEIHLNRYWRLLNESWVLIHATVVALQIEEPGGAGMWPAFTLGFGFVLVVTQVYGLPPWKKVSPYFRLIPVLLFIAITLTLAGSGVIKGRRPDETGFGRLYAVLFVPAMLYSNLFVAWLTVFLLIFIIDRTLPVQRSSSPTRQAISLCAVTMIYVAFIFASYVIRDLVMDVTILSIILINAFGVGIGVTLVLFKCALGPFGKVKARVKDKVEVVEMSSKVNQGATLSGENSVLLS